VRVEVAIGIAPRQVECVPLDLAEAATVHDAIAACATVLQRHGLGESALHCAVWGRRCDQAQALRDGDRLELCRSLTVDPKQARRLRYNGQRKAKRPANAGRGA
jgi:putative ubiquitin-RnfH superfamily antitoxin RatB of RatAB toxin-antitoxin module